MATLYTPEPQRQGLDWLSGLVRSGQELAQNERRIQLAQQQQQIAKQEFWTRQQALKRQEDFQNRKFLYEMGHDQRQQARLDLHEDRDWLSAQSAMKRADTAEFRAGTAEARLGRTEQRQENEYMRSIDPNSPENQYRAASTANLQASAEQTRLENAEMAPNQPKVTTYFFGETGTSDDTNNAFGGKVDEYSLALSPDQEKAVRAQGVKPLDWLEVKLGDGNIVARRWDDRTKDTLTGRWDFHGGEGPDPNDGKPVLGFRKTGQPDQPFVPLGSGSRPGGTTGSPSIEEHDGVKFIRYPRARRQGGDYFQLAPTVKGEKPHLTVELMKDLEAKGFEFDKFTVDGAVFTKPKETDEDKKKRANAPTLETYREGDKTVSVMRDPRTGELKPAVMGDGKLESQFDNAILKFNPKE